MELKEKNKVIHEFLGKKWPEKKMFQIDYLHTEPMVLWEAVEKIVQHKYGEGDDNAHFRTFGKINEDTGQFMVRINRHALFMGDTLKEAIFEAVADYARRCAENNVL